MFCFRLLLAAFLLLSLNPVLAQTDAATSHPAVPQAQSGKPDPPSATSAKSPMTAWQALLLGIVEGLTEYLPVSSTGHLLATQELLGIVPRADREDPAITPAENAANAFAIAIQGGAILAVLGLYWPRCRQMLSGLLRRDLPNQPGSGARGRNLFWALIAAFLPAAVIGLLADDWIEARLFGMKPVVIAWIVGGLGILLLSRWLKRRHGHAASQADDLAEGVTPATAPAERGLKLDQINWRIALGIGLFQCAAMWPGTSRSLMTIAGALLLGLSLTAAVEFSFLLGVLTLGAATVYALLKDGELLLHYYSPLSLAVGFLAAAVSAAVAIRWMVGYLKKHDLAIFGWYRLAIGLIAAVYLFT